MKRPRCSPDAIVRVSKIRVLRSNGFSQHCTSEDHCSLNLSIGSPGIKNQDSDLQKQQQ